METRPAASRVAAAWRGLTLLGALVTIGVGLGGCVVNSYYEQGEVIIAFVDSDDGEPFYAREFSLTDTSFGLWSREKGARVLLTVEEVLPDPFPADCGSAELNRLLLEFSFDRVGGEYLADEIKVALKDGPAPDDMFGATEYLLRGWTQSGDADGIVVTFGRMGSGTVLWPELSLSPGSSTVCERTERLDLRVDWDLGDKPTRVTRSPVTPPVGPGVTGW